MRKGCTLDTMIAMNKEEDKVEINNHPLFLEYMGVFPEALPSLPPHHELDFTIELKPGTKPIARTPYRMLVPELKELQIQLQELLDLGLI